ncbi:MAG: glycosyltransferase family 4 protein [Planctomycetota bacterium]|nr:glycosyltransferase family 4 protein [Planctomycetota bacterium]
MKFGGEAGLPWLCFKFLRQRGVDAHMVVHARTRQEVLDGFPNDHDRLHFAPTTRTDRLLWKTGSLLPAKIDAQTFGIVRHVYNQRLQRKIVRKLIAEKGIEIVHEINPVSPKQISLMHGLGVPVVIGPLAGGMLFPPAFAYMEPRGARALETVGRAISHSLNQLIPGKSQADGLIVANEQARQALPNRVRGKIFVIPDVGVDLSVWADESTRPPRNDGTVRFVYLGRLADWKGVNFLLDAFKIVANKNPDARLEILGDGQERRPLEAQSINLGLTNRVTFAGWVSAEQGARKLRSADVFVLPSLHEVGGIVILEAMAVGLPVITANWGGPAVHVSDDTGIRVRPDSKEAFVQGLADAMLRLADSPDLRARMSQAARQRVRGNLYDWNQKTDRLLEIYAELISAPK